MSNKQHPFVGKYCIARCGGAGVHAGTIVQVDGDQVVLSNSRRLWSWKAKSGVALSGLAQHGLAEGKIDTTNPEIALRDWVELIPCSDIARDSIENAAD